MKRIMNIVFALSTITAVVLMSGCGAEQAETETERVNRLLANGKWSLQDAVVDGVNQTDVYSGFTVTFTTAGFTTTNGEVIWPASGTWTLNDGANALTRNDNLVVTIDELSETKLVMGFINSETTFEPGRVRSVGGDHTFTMIH
jgi:hypothetical protein